MVRAQLAMHPRTFAVAIGGAAVFALATVASALAIQWVTDNVIVPRFEDGHVAVGTVVAGIALHHRRRPGAGRRRGRAPLVRRHGASGR